MSGTAQAWAEALLASSVPKRAKLREIERMIGDPTDRDCLDLGGDNGVISLFLRRKGGRWKSADLDEPAVDAIRALVGEGAERIVRGHLPFADQSFDLIVVVDLLEHLDDDAAFVNEIARVLRPTGTLVVNVPHPLRASPVAALGRLVGRSDASHGHVRPGYTRGTLATLLEPQFSIEEVRTYSRAFSELVDLAMHAGFSLLQGKATGEPSAKGRLVTRETTGPRSLRLWILRRCSPAFFAFAALDALLRPLDGHKLIVRASRPAGSAMRR